MKIEIDLSEWPERDLEILSSWASVSRTFNSAISAIETENADAIAIALDELPLLRSALDRLHQQVRDQIWQNSQNFLDRPQT